ncbi:hypothetical protein NPIL_604561 [Nephila pilipes]|uniref:Uncharacterized protein n=1 Tax=Nephila pilipes TaxID=299642 RepID=A0A8X6I589_NEPPI|nr:hypothetical protein NPIL_604561 [Nephila pilipes]
MKANSASEKSFIKAIRFPHFRKCHLLEKFWWSLSSLILICVSLGLLRDVPSSHCTECLARKFASDDSKQYFIKHFKVSILLPVDLVKHLLICL